mgnify:CR=1 FL=1
MMFSNLKTSKQRPSTWSVWPPSFSKTIWITAIVLLLGLLIPPIYLFYRSLFSDAEIVALMNRKSLWVSLLNSFVLMATVSFTSVLISIPCAWITTRSGVKGRGVWAVAFALPLVIPTYVGGFIVVIFLGPKGMLQQMLEICCGVERLPSVYGLWGATFTLAIFSYPYVYLSIRSGFLKLDNSLVEVAESLGLTRTEIFFKVILRQLVPSIVAGVLLVSLYVLSDFGAVSLLRYKTLSWSIFIQYGTALDRNVAAVYSSFLIITAISLTLGEAWLQGKGRFASQNSSPYMLRTGITSNIRNVMVTAFGIGLTTISVISPMALLVYWVIRGSYRGEILSVPWIRIWNSLYVAGIGALVVTVLSIPLVYVATRHSGWIAKVISVFVPIGFALPGISVALALVFFTAQLPRWIYQTVPVMIFAYFILFISPAFGIVRNGMKSVNPYVEEASLSLGKTELTTFVKVTLPLMMPSLTSAAAMVFLLIMKELPATLILAPLNFSNLATSTWSYAIEAFFAKSALDALLLVTISTIPLTYLMYKGFATGDVDNDV